MMTNYRIRHIWPQRGLLHVWSLKLFITSLSSNKSFITLSQSWTLSIYFILLHQVKLKFDFIQLFLKDHRIGNQRMTIFKTSIDSQVQTSSVISYEVQRCLSVLSKKLYCLHFLYFLAFFAFFAIFATFLQN